MEEMELFKEKEKGPYRDKLNATAKKRYLDKLSAINNVDTSDLVLVFEAYAKLITIVHKVQAILPEKQLS